MLKKINTENTVYATSKALRSTVFFVFDAECCSRSKTLRKKIKVCSDELAGMEGDYTAFANGKEFVNPQHPYSIDLDIFGPDSLFHRLNRTVTRHGSTVLAEKLMKLPDSKEYSDNEKDSTDINSRYSRIRRASSHK